MKKIKNGFTLIELLVVVLIIGILAAVALPQYQKAVWRSRNAQLKQLVNAISQAEQLYFLTNGTYAANFNELDLGLPLGVSTTTPGANLSCGVRVEGTDSVREGENFQIGLNVPSNTTLSQGISVVARWTEGKYKCTGFNRSIRPNNMGPLRCAERETYMDINPGEFCVKLEHATLETPGSGSKATSYTLP